MQTTKWLGLALALGGAAGQGCTEDSRAATEVAISVRTDLAIGAEITGFAVRVYAPNSVLPRDAEHYVSEREVRISTPADLERPIVIGKGSQDTMLVAVRALGAGGWSSQVVEHVLLARFKPGKSIAIPVYLSSACRNSACAATSGHTCYGEQHGTQCEGACAPIGEPDVQIEVEEPGDELGWIARRCQNTDSGLKPSDASMDASVDAEAGLLGTQADADLRDGSSDGGADASDGRVCTPTLHDAGCNLVEQCGCTSSLACQVDLTKANQVNLACVLPGTKKAGELCSSDVQCSAGTGCWFYRVGEEQVGWCRQYCTSRLDCGAGGLCRNIRVDEELVPEISICDTSCAQDSDCASGCCLNESVCAPKEACNLPPATPTKTCTPNAPWNGAFTPPAGTTCASDSDCCVGPAGQGHCLVPTATSDAGPAIQRCVSACTKPSDCASGCCSVPQTGADNFRGCVDSALAVLNPGICGT